MTTMTRRDVLKTLSLLAAAAAIPPAALAAADQEPAPPAYPVDHDFATPEELQAYLVALDSYIATVEGHVAMRSAEDLAGELARRITELSALAFALQAEPEKAAAVAKAIHVDDDCRYEWAVIAWDMAHAPAPWFHAEDWEDVKSHLWGLDSLPVPARVLEHDAIRNELEWAMGCLKSKPAQR